MNTRDKHPNARLGRVLYENDPHPSSQASLAKLNSDLWRTDETVYHGKRWKEFKDKFLDKIMANNGSLTCHYCKSDNLARDWQKEPNVPGNKKATLDHVIPTSHGGGLYDESNLVVACKNCNEKKGNKTNV
jgi:5-methylcytosine-specific restriction endonuclease McrA